MILSIGRYFCPTLQHTPIITPGIHKESHRWGPSCAHGSPLYLLVYVRMEGKYVAFKYYVRECLHDVSGQLEISWFSLQYYPSSFTTLIHCYPPFTTTHSLHHLLERNGIELICTGSEYFSLCNNTIAALPPMLRDVVTPLSRRTIALHTKLATKPTQDE